MTWKRTSSGLVVPSSVSTSRTRPLNGSSKIAKIGEWEFSLNAHDGLIECRNTTTGKYEAKTPREAETMVPQIAKHIGKSTKPGIENDAQERSKLMGQLQLLEAIVKEAKERRAEVHAEIRHRIR